MSHSLSGYPQLLLRFGYWPGRGRGPTATSCGRAVVRSMTASSQRCGDNGGCTLDLRPARLVLGPLLDAKQHSAGHQQDDRTRQLTAAAPAAPGAFAVRLRDSSRQRSTATGTMRNAQVASQRCSGGCWRSTRARAGSTSATRNA